MRVACDASASMESVKVKMPPPCRLTRCNAVPLSRMSISSSRRSFEKLVTPMLSAIDTSPVGVVMGLRAARDDFVAERVSVAALTIFEEYGIFVAPRGARSRRNSATPIGGVTRLLVAPRSRFHCRSLRSNESDRC